MSDLIDVNANNWEQKVTKSNLLAVVYFWHNQCPWCFQFTPILDEVAQEYRGQLMFVKLNMLEDASNQEIASNYGIMSTPTLMFFCGRRPVGQLVGYMSKEDLENALNSMLARYRQCLAQSTEVRPAYVV